MHKKKFKSSTTYREIAAKNYVQNKFWGRIEGLGFEISVTNLFSRESPVRKIKYIKRNGKKIQLD